MTKISYCGDKLTIDESTVALPDQIKEVVEINDLIIVLFKALGCDSVEDNIWAFNKDTDKTWTIEPAKMKSGEAYRYTGLWIDGGELWAYNWNGGGYKIDPKSGEILDSKLMK